MSKIDNPPWSITLAVAHVPPEGQHLVLDADEAARIAIAAIAGVPSISRIVASFDARPWRGDGLHLTGEVAATVTQNCIVTLEPMNSEIAEAVDLTFLPAKALSDLKPGTPVATVPVEGDDPPEPLVNGMVDLGAIATEFVLLGIDPYPRKSGAEFAPPSAEEPKDNPFAALAALKKGSGGS